MVDHQRLAHNPFDRHARIQRGERILEDDLNMRPDMHQLFAGQFFQVDPSQLRIIKPDFATGGIQQAHDGSGGGGLSAAAFTHQSQGFALLDKQVDPIDGLYHAHTAFNKTAFDRELLLEVFYVQEQIIDLKQGLGLESSF